MTRGVEKAAEALRDAMFAVRVFLESLNQVAGFSPPPTPQSRLHPPTLKLLCSLTRGQRRFVLLPPFSPFSCFHLHILLVLE